MKMIQQTNKTDENQKKLVERCACVNCISTNLNYKIPILK